MKPLLTARFEEALIFATRLHATQLRKGTTIPYIAHLLGVTNLVITHGGNEDEAIAALLHDSIEDQGATPALIEARFGKIVADIVEACTDTDVIPKPPWRQRKEKYLPHLAAAPPSVKLVAAADKLDNLRAILADYRTHGPALWSRFSAGYEDQVWYFRGCVSALKGGPESLVRELDLAVQQLKSLTGSL